MPVEPTTPAHYVTAALLRPMLAGLAALGLDVATLVAQAGLSLDTLVLPDTRVEIERVFALFGGAVAAGGGEALGLRLSQLYEPGVFGVLDHLASTADTLEEAIEVLCRYERIHQNGMVTTRAREGDFTVIDHAVLHALPVPRQVFESTIANLVVIGRRLTGVDFVPHEVRFTHAAPSDLSEHVKVFRCPLRWGAPSNAIVLPTSLLSTPLRMPNPDLRDVLDRHARELLAKLDVGGAVSARVREQLCAAFPKGDASLEQVAEALGMSARTLQRRLGDEGTSHGDLVEGLRRTLAERYLRQPDLAVEDVALLLGFSEARAFRRAFRRWTGLSPSEFRQKPSVPPTAS